MLRVLPLSLITIIFSANMSLAAPLNKSTESSHGEGCVKALESKKIYPLQNRFSKHIIYYSGPHKERVFTTAEVLSFVLRRPFVDGYEDLVIEMEGFLSGWLYKDLAEFDLELMTGSHIQAPDPFFYENKYVLSEDGSEKEWGEVARDLLFEQYPDLKKIKINDAIFNNPSLRLRWLGLREAQLGSELVVYQFHDAEPLERRHH